LIKLKVLLAYILLYCKPIIKITLKRNKIFASTAGGLRYWNGAVFASFKKFASHFLNPAFGVTEPKKAPNPVTGKSGHIRFEI
jgi:hypothetical protein